MAVKCNICLKTKGRRPCLRRDNKLICSKCCAELRKDFKCTSCPEFLLHETTKFMKYMYTVYDSDKIFPDRLRSITRRLTSLIDKKELEKAQEIVTPLLEQEPFSAELFFIQGTIFAHNKNYTEGIKYLDKALDIFPYYTEALYNKAFIYREQEDWHQEVKYLRLINFFSVERDWYVEKSIERLAYMEEVMKKENGISLELLFRMQEKKLW